jgi:uncharacterized SAM-binding protein YcdF (DUF218 family)
MKLFINLGIYIALFFVLVGSLGWYLAPRDELQKAEAIVAISGGDTKARTVTAAGLYNDKWASQLIVAGAAADPDSISNADQMRHIAIEEGVPTTAIRTETTSRDTKENAIKVAETFPEPPERIILVTSPYHQRRAFYQFEAAFPDTEIINYPAYDKTWRRSLWWVTPDGWYLTLSESAKLVFINITDK